MINHDGLACLTLDIGYWDIGQDIVGLRLGSRDYMVKRAVYTLLNG